jgi:hypothetical protein
MQSSSISWIYEKEETKALFQVVRQKNFYLFTISFYLKTICRSASSLIKINNMIVKVSNEVPP